LPKPAQCRSCEQPWPKYPVILKTSSSHEEGGERQWSISTKKFLGENSKIKRLSCVRVEFSKDALGASLIKDVPGSEFEIEADLVLLALGFLHPEKKGLLEQLGVELDARGNVKAGFDYATTVKKVFSCGDMRRGQSLVVWAISEGRQAACQIDKFLSK